MAVTCTWTPIALGVVLLALAAQARAATVVLVRTPHPSAIAIEATVRLRGELTAEGFDVRIVEAPEGEDLRASLEEAAAAADVEAVVAISVDSPTDNIELWVIDRVTGKTVTRRVAGEPATARTAEVLSIRALELLRASFLEIALGASRATPPDAPPPPPPPPEVTHMTEVALEVGWPKTWAIEVGGCVLGSFEGLTPSLAPMVRAERIWGQRFVGRLTLAGLGTRTHIERPPLGSATVAQDFALAEAGLKLRPRHGVQPFVSIGAGVLHVVAEGRGTSFPNRSRSGSLWTPIADVSGGVRIELRGRFELALELHAQVAQNFPVIQFFGENVAKAGRPTVLGSVTLVAWL